MNDATFKSNKTAQWADKLLHLLWTKALGTDAYDKTEWRKLERAIYKLACNNNNAGALSYLCGFPGCSKQFRSDRSAITSYARARGWAISSEAVPSVRCPKHCGSNEREEPAGLAEMASVYGRPFIPCPECFKSSRERIRAEYILDQIPTTPEQVEQWERDNPPETWEPLPESLRDPATVLARITAREVVAAFDAWRSVSRIGGEPFERLDRAIDDLRGSNDRKPNKPSPTPIPTDRTPRRGG